MPTMHPVTETQSTENIKINEHHFLIIKVFSLEGNTYIHDLVIMHYALFLADTSITCYRKIKQEFILYVCKGREIQISYDPTSMQNLKNKINKERAESDL